MDNVKITKIRSIPHPKRKGMTSQAEEVTRNINKDDNNNKKDEDEEEEKKKKKKKKEKSTKHREFFLWALKVFPNDQPISVYDLLNKYDNDPCFKKHAKKVKTDGDDGTLKKLCRMLASEYNSRFVQDRTSNNSLSHLTSALYKSSNIKKARRSKNDSFLHWASVFLPQDKPTTTKELLPRVINEYWFRLYAQKSKGFVTKKDLKKTAQKLVLAWNKRISRKKKTAQKSFHC